MTENLFDELKDWLHTYCAAIQTDDPDCRKNFELKLNHSISVAEEAEGICNSLNFNDETTRLAKITGLLHDVGRFRQYAEHRTFNDGISINHGELGASVIIDENLLEKCSQRQQTSVLRAVAQHNLAVTPCCDDSPADVLLKLVRDADKLDIYRIFNSSNSNVKSSLVVETGEDISDGVHADIMSGRPVALEHVANRLDITALKLAWIFDINYSPTIHRVLRRGYLDRMLADLPATDRAHDLKDRLMNHLQVWLSVNFVSHI